MKLLALFIIVFSAFSTTLKAQEDAQTKTLFGQKEIFKNSGFMLSSNYAITSFADAHASLLSLRGGVILNKKLTLGAFYNFSLNNIQPKIETDPIIYLDYQAGGALLEYTIYSDRLIHFTFPLFIGVGQIEMDNDLGDSALGEESFLLIEPSAMVEINLHKHVRFNIGTGYRFTGPIEYRNFNQSNISGLSGYVGLKFGIF